MIPIDEITTAQQVVKALGLKLPDYVPNIPKGFHSKDGLWRSDLKYPQWIIRDFFTDRDACMCLLEWAIQGGMKNWTIGLSDAGNMAEQFSMRQYGSNHLPTAEPLVSLAETWQTAVIRCIITWHRSK